MTPRFFSAIALLPFFGFAAAAPAGCSGMIGNDETALTESAAGVAIVDSLRWQLQASQRFSESAIVAPGLARAIAAGVSRWSRHVVLVGLAGSPVVDVFRDAGFPIAAEAFADRRYEPDGTITFVARWSRGLAAGLERSMTARAMFRLCCVAGREFRP